MARLAIRGVLAAAFAGCLATACGIGMAGLGPAETPGDSGAIVAPDVSSAEVGGPVDASEASEASEADAHAVVAPPEFAWYKLDETSGNVAHDSTSNGYHVALENVVWNTGANFAPVNGNGASGGFAVVGAGLRQAPVTFTAWLDAGARSDESSNEYAITPYPPNALSGDAPGSFGFGIGLNVWSDGVPGSALSVENVGYGFTNVNGSPFLAGTEYFVVAAIGTTSATLYVDGQAVATAPVTTPAPVPTTTLSLGVHNGDTGYGMRRFYVGRMRDVRVYKRVLTAAEVDALHTDGPAP